MKHRTHIVTTTELELLLADARRVRRYVSGEPIERLDRIIAHLVRLLVPRPAPRRITASGRIAASMGGGLRMRRGVTALYIDGEQHSHVGSFAIMVRTAAD